MRTPVIFCAIVLAAALALSAASGPAGTWKASFTTPDGTQRENTFVMKVDGDKLTGTVAGGNGEAAITDGKVSGDEITFSVMRNFGGNDVKILYKGKVSGDEIKFHVEVEGGDRSFDMTAKRVS